MHQIQTEGIFTAHSRLSLIMANCIQTILKYQCETPKGFRLATIRFEIQTVLRKNTQLSWNQIRFIVFGETKYITHFQRRKERKKATPICSRARSHAHTHTHTHAHTRTHTHTHAHTHTHTPAHTRTRTHTHTHTHTQKRPAAPWWWLVVKWCLMSSDVSWHIRDKLWPMPKHGSIILYVHGNQKPAR